jgi:twitching motility protein PilU
VGNSVEFDKLLKLMVEKKASDLFITSGVPPCIKVNGSVVSVNTGTMDSEASLQTVLSIMDESQQAEFLDKKELNFAISRPVLGRFRVSAFYQRNAAGMVLRRIESVIPSFEDLNLPVILEELAMTKRGIIIFVGATGTGKSTSLASMVGYRNANSKGHIITVEDPIEYVHKHRGCIITQREVGVDTESYEVALKNTLRQAPDVILIGEIRSRETMEHAITFAETGHLVLSTLHANNANQALDRILHFFPEDRHPQLWMDLSLNMRAMVAQQLIPLADGSGRRAAIEILINTPLVGDLVRKGEVHKIKEVMTNSTEQGMQTFDQALFQLYDEGLISYEDALAYADSKNDLRLLIKLQTETDTSYLSHAADDLEMEDDKDSGLINPFK